MTLRLLSPILMLLPALLISQEPLRPLRVDTPPVIDGDLSDAAWQNAPRVTDFKTFIPDFGKVQEQKTEVWMAYDPANLYFAFRCYDEPSKVKTSVAARDNIRPDDWVCINLDPFADAQGLTALYVNPSGIQSDSRFAGGNEDFSADLVWYSAGRLTDDGYNVEIQIPLKSLRYSDKDPVRMTVFFERYVSRTSEHGSYPELDPKKGFAFLPQMAPIEYTGLEHYTLLEVLPAVVFNQQSAHRNGTFGVSDVRREASVTMKYGITSDLIFDGTFNPDFSQVEADAGQVDVNLRFNLFFPEKRPFFLEGREYFALGATGGASPIQSLVHTRTIVDPIVGLKLSGKIGDQNVLSTLYSNDEIPFSPPGSPTKAHFLIGRYRRTLSEDSFVGAIGATREYGSQYNRVGGLDGKIRVGEGMMSEFHAFGSAARSATAPEATSHSLSAALSKSSRDIDYGISASDIGKDFQANMGFVYRTGITSMVGYIQPKWYPASEFWNRVRFGLTAGGTHDKVANLWERAITGDVLLLFRKNLTLVAQYNLANEVFLGQRFNTSNTYFLWGGQFTKWLGVSMNFRTGSAIFYSATPYGGTADRIFSRLTIQPSENIALEHSFTYAQFRGDTTKLNDYSYPINRLKLTYQFNRYLFFRWIAEYNGFRKRLPTDFLASFTYIPGTVLHVGYGMIYNRREWDPISFSYIPSDRLLQTNAGLFFKASYLWRM